MCIHKSILVTSCLSHRFYVQCFWMKISTLSMFTSISQPLFPSGQLPLQFFDSGFSEERKKKKARWKKETELTKIEHKSRSQFARLVSSFQEWMGTVSVYLMSISPSFSCGVYWGMHQNKEQSSISNLRFLDPLFKATAQSYRGQTCMFCASIYSIWTKEFISMRKWRFHGQIAACELYVKGIYLYIIFGVDTLLSKRWWISESNSTKTIVVNCVPLTSTHK